MQWLILLASEQMFGSTDSAFVCTVLTAASSRRPRH